jgi:chemotaxis response regulator CheB
MRNIRVIISARAGTWQRLLQNDIDSYPNVDVVAVGHGSLTTVQLIKKHQPDLLIIDSSIPSEDTLAILSNIKTENPTIFSVAIADTHYYRRKFTQAGVDCAVSTYEFKLQMQGIFDQFDKKLK